MLHCINSSTQYTSYSMPKKKKFVLCKFCLLRVQGLNWTISIIVNFSIPNQFFLPPILFHTEVNFKHHINRVLFMRSLTSESSVNYILFARK